MAHGVVDLVRHLLADTRRAIAWHSTYMNMDLRLRLAGEVTWWLLVAWLLEAWLDIAGRLLVAHGWLLETRLRETHRRLLLVALRWEATHLLRECLRSSHHRLLHHRLLHHGLLHHGLLHHGLLHHRLLHHRLLHHGLLLELWVLLD